MQDFLLYFIIDTENDARIFRKEIQGRKGNEVTFLRFGYLG